MDCFWLQWSNNILFVLNVLLNTIFCFAGDHGLNLLDLQSYAQYIFIFMAELHFHIVQKKHFIIFKKNIDCRLWALLWAHFRRYSLNCDFGRHGTNLGFWPETCFLFECWPWSAPPRMSGGGDIYNFGCPLILGWAGLRYLYFFSVLIIGWSGLRY